MPDITMYESEEKRLPKHRRNAWNCGIMSKRLAHRDVHAMYGGMSTHVKTPNGESIMVNGESIMVPQIKKETEPLQASTKVSLETLYPILKFFRYDHLPPHLRLVAKGSADLAFEMVRSCHKPEAMTHELSAGLRKLLEAKDAFVRAALDT
jgi:hypothetical protein